MCVYLYISLVNNIKEKGDLRKAFFLYSRLFFFLEVKGKGGGKTLNPNTLFFLFFVLDFCYCLHVMLLLVVN